MMIKTLRMLACAVALVAIAGCNKSAPSEPMPAEPSPAATGVVPVPPLTFTTVAPMTVGQVRP